MPVNDVKKAWIDLETTGLDHNIHGVTQIAGFIEIGSVIKRRFNFNVKPITGQKVSIEALEKTRKTMEEIRSYPSAKDIYNQLTKIFSEYVDRYDKKDKLHFYGYNSIPFDSQFLRRFFENNGDMYFGSMFWYPIRDICADAGRMLEHVRHHLKNFKLKTVCEFMKIEWDEEKAHDAMYDIEKTRELHLHLESVDFLKKVNSIIQGESK